MKEFLISERNEGQRVLRFSEKLLPSASRGFLYKAFRKKTIDCNGKKCTGKETLRAGDVVRFWLSDETFAKFSAAETASRGRLPADFTAWIVYEDADVLIFDKPAGMPVQGGAAGVLSLDDCLLLYLGESVGVRPSACHRLDRNTEGLVLCGKSSRALTALSDMLAARTIRKYYRALVFGAVPESGRIETGLVKDETKNLVRIVSKETDGARLAVTEYRLLETKEIGGVSVSEIEVHLVTGRAHQIRVHTAGIGHPILGDVKYGTKESIAFSRRLGLSGQCLIAARIVFPKIEGALSHLSEKEFTAPVSRFPSFEKICYNDDM
jgi:23S rRNA pseudouridine955/2504/2580 synthase